MSGPVLLIPVYHHFVSELPSNKAFRQPDRFIRTTVVSARNAILRRGSKKKIVLGSLVRAQAKICESCESVVSGGLSMDENRRQRTSSSWTVTLVSGRHWTATRDDGMLMEWCNGADGWRLEGDH